MSSAFNSLRIGFIVGLACLLGGCGVFQSDARYVETRHMTVPHEVGSGLAVTTGNGAVTVQSATGQQDVQITATLKCITKERLQETKILAEREGGKLKVEVAWPGGRAENNEGCSFEITLPDCTGVDAQTSNGSVTLRNLGGSALAQTSNGAITITDQAGAVDASSSNGRIVVHNAAGELSSHTSNGSIEIEGARRSVDAGTSNGSIRIVLTDESSGPVTIHSSNGNVDLTLGKSFAGQLNVSTSNGSLHLGEFTDAKKVSVNEHSASLVIGSGGTSSEVRTSNGSVQVRSATE